MGVVALACYEFVPTKLFASSSIRVRGASLCIYMESCDMGMSARFFWW